MGQTLPLRRYLVNSFQDLNNYGKTSVTFNDNRIPQVKFFPATISNQTITVDENVAFISPNATDIDSIVNIPEPIVFTVNLSSLTNVTLSWPGLAGNLAANTSSNLVANSSGHTYSVYGIRTIRDWELVKHPVITANTVDDFIYSSTIKYIGGQTATWITSAAVSSKNELTVGSDFYYYDNQANPLVGHPTFTQITIPSLQSDTYTLTINPGNLTIFGTGNISTSTVGNLTTNTSTKVVTVVGNTTAISGALANVTYNAPFGADSTWIATYELFNPVSGYRSHREQTIRSITSEIMTRSNVQYFPVYYNDTVKGYPVINNPTDFANLGHVYMTEVYPLDANTISTIGIGANNGTQGNVVVANKKITMIGTKANINYNLADIQIKSAADFQSQFQLVYKTTIPANATPFSSPPTGNVATRIQTFYANISGVVNNMTVSRSFNKNTPAPLFPTDIPQITDTRGGSYTIYLKSSAGEFGLANTATSSNYSYTGTYGQINTIFPQINFYPYKDVTGNQTFTYSQYRQGAVEIQNQQVQLIGSTVDLSPANVTVVLTSSGSYTPTFEQKTYYKMNVLAVGAGGNGGYTPGYTPGLSGTYILPWNTGASTYQGGLANVAGTTMINAQGIRWVGTPGQYNSYSVSSWVQVNYFTSGYAKLFNGLGGTYQFYPANIGGAGGGGGRVSTLENIDLKTSTAFNKGGTFTVTVGQPATSDIPVTDSYLMYNPNQNPNPATITATVGYNGGDGGASRVGNITAGGGFGGTHNFFGVAVGGTSGDSISSGKPGGNAYNQESSGAAGADGVTVSWFGGGNVALGAGGGATLPDTNYLNDWNYLHIIGYHGGNYNTLTTGGGTSTTGAYYVNEYGQTVPGIVESGRVPSYGCGGAGGPGIGRNFYDGTPYNTTTQGGKGIVVLYFHK